jgi:hypothetical protein
MNGVVKIIEKKTGKENTAVYGRNRRGNLRYNVDGKFLSDKEFNKHYSLVDEVQHKELSWKVHIPSLFNEIVENGGLGTSIFRVPLSITSRILGEVAQRALELNDPKLNALMCRLTLYEQSDPYSKEYNPKLTNDTISKFYNR